MPAGLQIINDYGSIQIDENYTNLSLVNKGTSTLGTRITYSKPTWSDSVWASSNGTSIDASTGQSNYGLIAFRGRGDSYIGIKNGGFGSVGFFGYTPNGQPPVVDWWAFGRPVSSGNYGLEIRDAQNNMIYSSNTRTMNVVATAVDAYIGYSNVLGVSASAGNYALIAGCPLASIQNSGNFGGIVSNNSGGYNANEARPCWKWSGSGFSGVWKPTQSREFFNYPIQSGGGQYLVMVDVNGL